MVLSDYKQFIKFVFIGLTYNLFAYLVYAILIFINCNYFFACTTSFILGVVLSYYLNKIVVFNSNKRVIIRYILFYFFLLGLNLGLLFGFIKFFYINKYVAQILVTGISSFISYYTMRILIFEEAVSAPKTFRLQR